MYRASSRLRFAAAPFTCALALLLAPAGHAQTIDLSLNVFYSTPSNIASGGAWELVAKTSSPVPNTNFGIAGIVAEIKNINGGGNAIDEGPRGTVNGSNPAGFGIFNDDFLSASPAHHELTIAQFPINPLPSGNEQGLFYGVGTLTNGAPNYPGKPAGSNFIGPVFTSLTATQDIPWATGDSLGDSSWDSAARMASGTFPSGVTPAFVTGSLGNIFTSIGTSTTPGNEIQAAITTTVRTNFVANSADYNHNGIVDAADYVIWRKTFGATATPPGSGADGNADGTVNAADYTLWRAHFGNPFGAGTGGDLFTGAVPEPTSCILLAFGAMLTIGRRRPRRECRVNN